MTQEIVTINSEADVRISREAVDSVKGKFTKSNLGGIHKKSQNSLIKNFRIAAIVVLVGLVSLIFFTITPLPLIQWEVHSLLTEPSHLEVDSC